MSGQDKILFAFDWNGTLLDDLSAIVTAFAAAQTYCGYKPFGAEQLQEAFDFPLDRWYRNAGFDERIIQSRLGEVHQVTVDVYTPLEDKASLRRGAEIMLDEVTKLGALCAVFSNHFKGRIQSLTERMNIRSLLDEILASRDLEEQLTAPSKKDRLRQYMAARGVSPEHTFVIGDTPEEIHIAHEFGAIGIAITGGFASQKRLEACNPHYLVHSLAEIPAIARKAFPNWGPQ